MPKIKPAKFRLHFYAAFLLPLLALGLFSLIARQMSGFILGLASILLGLGALWYVARLFSKYEELAWREQLQGTIQKSTIPMLVADNKHHIVSINDNFYRLPLATALSKVKSLAELLTFQKKMDGGSALPTEKSQLRELLGTFTGKLKAHLYWQGNRYEAILIPLYNTQNERYGTLVECILKDTIQNQPAEKKEEFPLSAILEQIAVPFLFVNESQQISYANLSLKMLLVRYAGFIQTVCPNIDVYDPAKMNMDQLMALIGKEKESFFNLVQQGTVVAKLGEEQFQISLQPLWTAENERLGMLVLWHEATAKNSVAKENENFVLSAMDHLSHPVILLDKICYIQYATPLSWLTADMRDKNFMDIMKVVFPKMVPGIRNALKRGENATIITEHEGEYYDWVITPIKSNKQIRGYVIEIITPSLQEVKGLEEKEQRARARREKLEKELAKFTHGLTEFKLYQQDAEGLTKLKSEEYQHPLLKNSTKMIQHLAGTLQKLNEKISNLHQLLQAGTSAGEQALSLPLQQMSVLANSVLRNVQEAKQDCAVLDQELLKFKGAIREQKGLNQAFIKPVSKAIAASEQGLMQSVGHSQTITLILQQLHENQTALTEIQNFLERLGKLKGSAEFEAIEPLYQQGVTLLDKIKQTMVIGKGRLRELLMNYDNLKEGWNVALENLRSCLQLNSTVDNAAGRWSSISEAADGYSQVIQNRLHNLMDLAQKIQAKSLSWKNPSNQEPSSVDFDHVAIEVDENKKRAEEVLIEGIAHK